MKSRKIVTFSEKKVLLHQDNAPDAKSNCLNRFSTLLVLRPLSKLEKWVGSIRFVNEEIEGLRLLTRNEVLKLLNVVEKSIKLQEDYVEK